MPARARPIAACATRLQYISTVALVSISTRESSRPARSAMCHTDSDLYFLISILTRNRILNLVSASPCSHAGLYAAFGVQLGFHINVGTEFVPNTRLDPLIVWRAYVHCRGRTRQRRRPRVGKFKFPPRRIRGAIFPIFVLLFFNLYGGWQENSIFTAGDFG